MDANEAYFLIFNCSPLWLVGAQGTLRELPAGLSDGVLSAISEEEAKQGLVVDALVSSAQLSNPQARSASLRQIAIIRGAQGTLHDAREAIDQISQPAARAEAVATLALQQPSTKTLQQVHNPGGLGVRDCTRLVRVRTSFLLSTHNTLVDIFIKVYSSNWHLGAIVQ